MGNSNAKPDIASGSKGREDRLSEATSDKTLSELEENETDSSENDSGLDPGPSPDGVLDERDEIRDDGPM